MLESYSIHKPLAHMKCGHAPGMMPILTNVRPKMETYSKPAYVTLYLVHVLVYSISLFIKRIFGIKETIATQFDLYSTFLKSTTNVHDHLYQSNLSVFMSQSIFFFFFGEMFYVNGQK